MVILMAYPPTSSTPGENPPTMRQPVSRKGLPHAQIPAEPGSIQPSGTRKEVTPGLQGRSLCRQAYCSISNRPNFSLLIPSSSQAST